jgi:hypothetical protein
MGYIVAVGCFVAFYIFWVKNMERITSYRLVNIFASASVYLMYLSLMYVVYSDVGFYDWNFQNTLPVANVSPFMFSLMPLTWILPKRAKKYLYLLISLLSVGMLFSPISGCVYNAVIGYKFHWHFMLDYVAHLILSAWGVYLVKSGQVMLDRRDCLISGSLIVGVAAVMMLLNVIFDTAFFGLSLNGKHNIYNNVIVDSSVISAIIYFVGLVVVLLLGYGLNKMLSKKH